MAKIQEEGLVLIVINELQGRLRDFVVGVGDSLRIFGADWGVFFDAEWIGWVVHGGKVRDAIGVHAAMHSPVMIHCFEAVVCGIETDVPFPGVTGAVAIRLQGIGTGEDVAIELCLEVRSDEQFGGPGRHRGHRV